jgi:hypothetical protein
VWARIQSLVSSDVDLMVPDSVQASSRRVRTMPKYSKLRPQLLEVV